MALYYCSTLIINFALKKEKETSQNISSFIYRYLEKISGIYNNQLKCSDKENFISDAHEFERPTNYFFWQQIE